jgi:hypothetical protein
LRYELPGPIDRPALRVLKSKRLRMGGHCRERERNAETFHDSMHFDLRAALTDRGILRREVRRR